LSRSIDVGPFEPCIITSQNRTLIPEEFFSKAGGADAQVCFFDVLRSQPCETGEFRRDSFHLRLRKAMSLRECFRVGSARKRAHFIEESLFVLSTMRHFFVMPRNRRI